MVVADAVPQQEIRWQSLPCCRRLRPGRCGLTRELVAVVSHPLVLPMATHVGWVMSLYVLLTLARAPAVWGLGRRPDGSDPWSAIEPRISANLSNQFEWPLFFHAACLLMIALGTAVDTLHLVLAWTFVGGRIAHSAVQILTTNVRLRGLVFTINFVAVLGMWLRLLLG
jgi:hypothetical protein